MRTRPYSRSEGFSLIEVVIVLVLISILAVIVISRHIPDVTLSAQTQVLTAHIRYAQLHSMNTDLSWGIHYDQNQQAYWLFNNGDTGTGITLPGQTEDRVRLDELGITISPGSFALSFDGWGRPSSDLAGTGTLTLTLTKSGQNDQQIRIIRETGFIQ